MNDHPKITPINLGRTFTAAEVNELIDQHKKALRRALMAASLFFALGLFVGRLVA